MSLLILRIRVCMAGNQVATRRITSWFIYKLHLIGKNLGGKILAIVGKSAKTTKISPHQNFALYGIHYY